MKQGRSGRLACIQSEGEIKEVSGELTDTELDSAAGGSGGNATWGKKGY